MAELTFDDISEDAARVNAMLKDIKDLEDLQDPKVVELSSFLSSEAQPRANSYLAQLMIESGISFQDLEQFKFEHDMVLIDKIPINQNYISPVDKTPPWIKEYKQKEAAKK